MRQHGRPQPHPCASDARHEAGAGPHVQTPHVVGPPQCARAAERNANGARGLSRGRPRPRSQRSPHHVRNAKKPPARRRGPKPRGSSPPRSNQLGVRQASPFGAAKKPRQACRSSKPGRTATTTPHASMSARLEAAFDFPLPWDAAAVWGQPTHIWARIAERIRFQLSFGFVRVHMLLQRSSMFLRFDLPSPQAGSGH